MPPRQQTSRWAPMAARQAARRRFEKPVRFVKPTRQHKSSFLTILFLKEWQGGGAAPLLALRRGRNTPNDTKRSGRAAQTSRWDVWAKGNPIKGFPAGQRPAKKRTNNNRASEKKRQTLRLAGAVFALDESGVGHAAIFSKLRPRGHPRAACGPPFLLFGLRPRRNGVRVSLSAESEEGRCPSTLPAF